MILHFHDLSFQTNEMFGLDCSPLRKADVNNLGISQPRVLGATSQELWLFLDQARHET